MTRDEVKIQILKFKAALNSENDCAIKRVGKDWIVSQQGEFPHQGITKYRGQDIELAIDVFLS
jgi:hypothetical protein